MLFDNPGSELHRSLRPGKPGKRTMPKERAAEKRYIEDGQVPPVAVWRQWPRPLKILYCYHAAKKAGLLPE